MPGAAWGCPLFGLPSEPPDDTTAGLAIHYVSRAVETWEPRVTVLGIEAGVPDDVPSVPVVRMRYRFKATQGGDEVADAVPIRGTAASSFCV